MCGGLLVYIFVEYVLHTKRNEQLKKQNKVNTTRNVEHRLQLLEDDILVSTGKEKNTF